MLVAQLGLYVVFFFVPQALLAAFGSPPSIGWEHVGGLALLGLAAVRVRSDWAPVEPGSVWRISRATKALVFGSFIALQLVDAWAVLRGGHQILYLEDRPSSALAFVPLKILGSGAVGLSVATLAGAARLRAEPLALGVLASTLGPGTRGVFFFGMISVLLLRNGWRRLVRARYVAAAAVGAALLALLGLLREEIGSDVPAYAQLVVAALNAFVESNVTVADCGIPASLVLTQLPSVLLGRIDETRVTYEQTYCHAPQALEGGYGIATSALGELSLLVGPVAAAWAYAAVPLGYAALLTLAYRRGGRFARLMALASVPYVLYTVRAELVFPVTYLVKMLIGFHVALGLDGLMASLFHRGGDDPPEAPGTGPGERRRLEGEA
jgi:hypothetical protein